jgi:hypothetical protein
MSGVLFMHDEFALAKECALSFGRNYGFENLLVMGNIPEVSGRLADELYVKHDVWPLYIDRLRAFEANHENKLITLRVNLIRDLLLSWRRCALSLDTDFLMFLHPDHRVLRRIPESRLRSDIDFYQVNKYDAESKKTIEIVLDHSISLSGYGLPTFIRRSSLLRCLELLLDHRPDILVSLMELDARFVYDDFLLPTIFDFLGFEISDSALMFEVNRRRRLRHLFRKPPLLHQVRN